MSAPTEPHRGDGDAAPAGPAERELAEGGPAESGPAESGPAESGPAESGPASPGPTPGRVAALVRQFDEALAALEAAPRFAAPRYQTVVYGAAADLLDSAAGMAALFARAPRFDAAGVFRGGPWEDPSRLLPELVGVGLKGEGVYPTVEALSELRMLAIATGQATSDAIDAEAARRFLRDVCARNLDLLLFVAREESRVRVKVFRRAERLFSLIREHVPIEGLRADVVEEIHQLCAQRPILTDRTEQLIELAAHLPPGDEEDEAEERLALYRAAIGAASPLARAADDLAAYRREVRALSPDALAEEARPFARTMRETGLVSPYHAVVLRRIARAAPDRLGEALGVNEVGLAELTRSADLVAQLVAAAVFPATATAIHGLAALLERGLLARTEVVGGLRRIVDLAIRTEVADVLLAPYPASAGLSPNSVLLAGAVSVLGQPLGVGQGNNPTCQSARGISLWSLHAPGLLLQMVANAARDGLVAVDFEGHHLRSDELAGGGVARGAINLDLDPVSAVLVPHLDRLYSRMMELAALRGEDGHKWVNPALYGRWVPKGFVSAIDALTHAVRRHGSFVRRFYATHHPEYNDDHALIYPNPVGIMVTNVHGDLLGPHAVSIQRIARAPDGALRIYFFNPNNEGRQEWGGGVTPTVYGHGERPGESSLPFGQFVSRMYAFHYDPFEEGDAYAVPAEVVAEVSGMAASTWGRAYPWTD